MELNAREQAYLGKECRTTRDLDYGINSFLLPANTQATPGVLRAGTKGVVRDYGSDSGDPSIELENGFQVIVPWECLRF